MQLEVQGELKKLNEKLHSKRTILNELKNIEERYDEARLTLQELSFTDLNVDTEIGLKQREINRLNIDLKSTIRDIEESEIELKKIYSSSTEKEKLIGKKEVEEQELYEKFQKFFPTVTKP